MLSPHLWRAAELIHTRYPNLSTHLRVEDYAPRMANKFIAGVPPARGREFFYWAPRF